jgi:2-polyprenyl-3-methyl-5-hydroxy-6-metoxy-1,4-benzoquinol methylase
VFKSKRYEQRRLRELARRAHGVEVLDVGYSQRPNLGLVSRGRRVTGLDINSPACDTGYDRHLTGDVFDLKELDDGRRYDTIVAGEFIEHIERPYDLLRLFAQALAPGGRLVLSTPNPVSFPVVAFEWLCSRRRFYTTEHTYYFAPRWVIRMLEGTDWIVDEMIPVGLWPLGIPCPVGLSYHVIYVALRPEGGSRPFGYSPGPGGPSLRT